MSKSNERIIKASGKVTSDDNLVSFLYELMRDHLPSGVVEGIAQRVLEEEDDRNFCNGWLAKHAIDIAERLKDGR